MSDDVRLAVLGDADVWPVVSAVAAWQADPAHHVCFVAVAADEIAEEFAEVVDWRQRCLVARRDGEVTGVVLADVDADRGRTWWFGPWGVDDESRAAVLDRAASLLPAGVTQQEFGPDRRNEAVGRLAAARGAMAGTPSSVLVLDPLVVPEDHAVDGVAVVEFDPVDHATPVAEVHDQLFPDTHTTGAALVAAQDTTLLVAVCGADEVAVGCADVVGYVATEVHADGGLYIDYLGVAASARRRGVARSLLTTALRRAASGGRPRSHLTVRHDAEGARELYLSLGYTEERVIQPWRIGFET